MVMTMHEIYVSIMDELSEEEISIIKILLESCPEENAEEVLEETVLDFFVDACYLEVPESGNVADYIIDTPELYETTRNLMHHELSLFILAYIFVKATHNEEDLKDILA